LRHPVCDVRVACKYQPQFNSQDRLHQLSPHPSAEEILQLQQRFGSSTSITPADSTAQLHQLGCDDDDVTDDARETRRRESVASCSSSRSVSFLRLRSHSLRYIHRPAVPQVHRPAEKFMDNC